MSTNMGDPVIHKRSLGFMFNYLVDVKINALKMWIDSNDSIVDVGAGFGQYAERLHELGYNVFAVEPDERYIKTQKTVPYTVCMAEDIVGKYDVAYMFNVLHHTDNPILVVQRVLASSKRVVVSEINRKNIFVRFYINHFMKHEDINGHYSESDVRDVVHNTGGVIKAHFTTGLFGIPFVYNWFIIERY